jgi:hypothetical protein
MAEQPTAAPRSSFVRRADRAIVIGKPGRNPTAEAWRVTRRQIRRRPGTFAGAILLITAFSLMIGVVGAIAGHPFLAGWVSGTGLAALLAVLTWVRLITDGSVTWRVGALGELWTSDELRLLGRGWTVLNGVAVPGDRGAAIEIDHIAVGPGGVLTVESKLWPSQQGRLDLRSHPYIVSAANKAHTQAGFVRYSLRKVVPPEVVSPTVIVWGADLLSADGSIVANPRTGVKILDGRDAAAWREAIGYEVLNSERVAEVIGTLRPYLIARRGAVVST